MAIKLNYDTLIKEVEKRSPLWDRRDPNHNNMVVVSQLWEEISGKLNAPVEIIKKKWRSLRNQFRSQYNKLTMQKGKGENITLKSNWLFFESLLFLISQMESNPKKQLHNNENHLQNETSQKHDNEKTEENQSKQNTDNSLENDSKILETAIDEDEAFFQSLIPHIEKMEPERRLLCRIEIQRVIYNFAYKENK